MAAPDEGGQASGTQAVPVDEQSLTGPTCVDVDFRAKINKLSNASSGVDEPAKAAASNQAEAGNSRVKTFFASKT